MVIWFAAASFLIVVMVFDSPAVDYRMVMLGAVAPVLEGAVAGPWLLHTVVGCAAVFVVVVTATRGRRLAARGSRYGNVRINDRHLAHVCPERADNPNHLMPVGVDSGSVTQETHNSHLDLGRRR